MQHGRAARRTGAMEVALRDGRGRRGENPRVRERAMAQVGGGAGHAKRAAQATRAGRAERSVRTGRTLMA